MIWHHRVHERCHGEFTASGEPCTLFICPCAQQHAGLTDHKSRLCSRGAQTLMKERDASFLMENQDNKHQHLVDLSRDIQKSQKAPLKVKMASRAIVKMASKSRKNDIFSITSHLSLCEPVSGLDAHPVLPVTPGGLSADSGSQLREPRL